MFPEKQHQRSENIQRQQVTYGLNKPQRDRVKLKDEFPDSLCPSAQKNNDQPDKNGDENNLKHVSALERRDRI